MPRKPKDEGNAIATLMESHTTLERANRQLTEQLAAALGDERGTRAGFDVLCRALSDERAKVKVLTAQNEQLAARVHAMLPKPVVAPAPVEPKPKRKYTRRQPLVLTHTPRRKPVGRPRKGART